MKLPLDFSLFNLSYFRFEGQISFIHQKPIARGLRYSMFDLYFLRVSDFTVKQS